MPFIEFFKNFTPTPTNILKVIGLVVGALFVLAIGFSVLSSVFAGFPSPLNIDMDGVSVAGAPAYYKEEMAYDSSYSGGYGGGEMQLSARNVSPTYPYPQPGGTTGDTAEEFEVTEYSASIESRNKSNECGAIADLKAKEYVIFESANESDKNCTFTFKVKHDNVEEILAFIKEMDPRDLSENTYTIKNQVDDFTSETDILTKKLASLDETLASALKAYDDIQRLATQNQNAEALAKVIDSKIQLIERLAQSRITINEQLDRYARMKSEQLDRLDYTYFHVSVYERAFVDGEQIADSWKQALAATISDVNQNLQAMSLGFVAFLSLVLQYVLLSIILIFVAKYLWRAAVYIWNK
jgi:hypothetical protein